MILKGNISDVLNKRLAEEGWMNVHKQLNDWGSIQNVIKGIENIDLHIELAWQTKEKRTLEKFIQSTETFNADSLMIQVTFPSIFIVLSYKSIEYPKTYPFR